jgi:hypothetical protein
MAGAEGARQMTTRTRTRQLRNREAAQLADALTQAQSAVSRARTAWGLWADTVRQEAEAAHGVGYTPDDPVILQDDQYRGALDLGTELDQALPDVPALISRLWRIEQQAAEAAQ